MTQILVCTTCNSKTCVLICIMELLRNVSTQTGFGVYMINGTSSGVRMADRVGRMRFA